MTHPSVRPSIHLSIDGSSALSICPSIHPAIRLLSGAQSRGRQKRGSEICCQFLQAGSAKRRDEISEGTSFECHPLGTAHRSGFGHRAKLWRGRLRTLSEICCLYLASVGTVLRWLTSWSLDPRGFSTPLPRNGNTYKSCKQRRQKRSSKQIQILETDTDPREQRKQIQVLETERQRAAPEEPGSDDALPEPLRDDADDDERVPGEGTGVQDS